MSDIVIAPMEPQLQFVIPNDFPQSQHFGAVGGAQPKFLVVQYEGKFYAPGCTPPELFSRWNICEDLALQLVVKSMESKAGKRSHMSESEILDQYCLRLLKTGWGSDDEIRWVTRRAAAQLGWSVPPSAEVLATRDGKSGAYNLSKRP